MTAFKTFTELVSSPLANETEELEKILLEFNIKFGTIKLGIRAMKNILSLIHEVYHTSKDVRLDSEWFEDDKPQTTTNLAKSLLTSYRRFSPTIIPTNRIQIQSNNFFTVSDLENLSHPTDVILRNLFKIMFELDVWNDLVLDPRLEKHVTILKLNAGSRISKTSDDKNEKWRKCIDHKMEALFEIWSEMLDRISSKKKQLLAI
jgi:hypothetical protein